MMNVKIEKHFWSRWKNNYEHIRISLFPEIHITKIINGIQLKFMYFGFGASFKFKNK